MRGEEGLISFDQKTGIVEGGSLGSMTFSTDINALFKKVNSICPSLMYIDNCTSYGSVPKVMQAIQELETGLEKTGQRRKPGSKVMVWGCKSEEELSENARNQLVELKQAFPDVSIVYGSMTILGTNIGFFNEQLFKDRIAITIAKTEALLRPGMDPQTAVALLARAVIKDISFHLRTCLFPIETRNLLKVYDNVIFNTIKKIGFLQDYIDQEEDSEAYENKIRSQVFMNLKYAGLGISSAEITQPAAYLAAVASLCMACPAEEMRKMFEVGSVMLSNVEFYIRVLKSKGIDSVAFDKGHTFPIVDNNEAFNFETFRLFFAKNKPKRIQRAFSQEIQYKKNIEFQASLGRMDKGRIAAILKDSGCASYLLMLPRTNDLTLSAGQYAFSLQKYLGCVVVRRDSKTIYGVHNELRDAVAIEASKRFITVSKTGLEVTRRPGADIEGSIFADLRLCLDGLTNDFIDFTVINSITESNAILAPGQPIKNSLSIKAAKYKDAARKIYILGADVIGAFYGDWEFILKLISTQLADLTKIAYRDASCLVRSVIRIKLARAVFHAHFRSIEIGHQDDLEAEAFLSH